MKRRDFIRTAAAMSAFFAPFPSLYAAIDGTPRTFGGSRAFSFTWLKYLAKNISKQGSVARQGALPAELQGMTWDQYQAINFRRAHDLWHDSGNARYRAQLFHLGLYFQKPVAIYEVADGRAMQIAYDPAMFDYGKSGIEGEKLPEELGFAGFRLFHHGDWQRDRMAFLGASYFRAVSGSMQYGLSARGLAIDTGLNRAEEFPDFTRFWLERPDDGSDLIHVYALLESKSITGAYHFRITVSDSVVMDIDAYLYPRAAIERLGVAPLTSMYMTGENDKEANWDWRPEIHDSDGLAMYTGDKEWLWRPLVNPPQLRFNAYADNNPNGFGLSQRDRQFDHYQDDGVFYERRPSVWIEPTSEWGKGSIQLLELPTLDETFDNIVAFWNPDRPVKPGEELHFGYRIHWRDRPPVETKLAQCVATRTGIGGEVGKRREYYSRRFAVDFRGGPFPLKGNGKGTVTPVIETSTGRVEITSARPLHEIDGYRAMFDVVPPENTDPINLRLYLKSGDTALTETWIYQWTPPPLEQRELYNPGHL